MSPMLSEPVKAQIEQLISQHKVLLFMKGNKHFPQCGFSAQVVKILKDTGTKFETVNVLQDPAMREGIKEFSSWPTIPQLYVDGEFIGGCDIVKEMYASGDLQKKLGVEETPVAPPRVTIDEGALKAIRAADEGTGDVLRLEIGPQFQYDFHFGPRKPGDVEVSVSGLALCFDRESAKVADGLHVAWVNTPDGGAFRIDNPNEPARVKPIAAADVKRWQESGKAFAFFDVRTDEERAIASVKGAEALDANSLRAVDKDTPIVFMCHHGMRSRSAAERALADGFRRVFNLEGGIEAWSLQVDSSVPRY